MKRVLSVTSSRADAGILAPVWRAIIADGKLELHILVTGMHLAPSAPPPALPNEATAHVAGRDIGGGDPKSAVEAMAAIAGAAAHLIADVEPVAVLLIGDRLDMFPVALAAVPFNVPMVHLHGGEVTEGAVDDRLRHAISKLSHRHCVSCAEARDNLVAMGEEPERITITGAPGLDSLLEAPVLDRDAFFSALNIEATDALRLVTVHPETNSLDPTAPLEAILEALDRSPSPTVFTAPNSDPGGAGMRQRIECFVAERPWATFVDTLGVRLYANALRYAAVMIGNSSSGIIEAPLFGLPVIDVGARQQGRLRAENVRNCPATADTVAAAIDQVAGCRMTNCSSPYGDGHAGPRVAQVLGGIEAGQGLLTKKLHRANAAT